MVKKWRNFNLLEPQQNRIFLQFNNDQYCTHITLETEIIIPIYRACSSNFKHSKRRIGCNILQVVWFLMRGRIGLYLRWFPTASLIKMEKWNWWRNLLSPFLNLKSSNTMHAAGLDKFFETYSSYRTSGFQNLLVLQKFYSSCKIFVNWMDKYAKGGNIATYRLISSFLSFYNWISI